MELSGSTAPAPGGVQSASVDITAAQLRALSTAGQGVNVVPGQTGKRLAVLAVQCVNKSGTVFFAAGSMTATSNTDINGGGTDLFWASLPNAGQVGTMLSYGGPSMPLGNAADNVGEGIYVFPINYVTALANVVLTVTVLYQYI